MPSMMRYLRNRDARGVVADPADDNSWIGGSERGLWITRNRGATWEALRFPDGQHPQILRFAKIAWMISGSLSSPMTASG